MILFTLHLKIVVLNPEAAIFGKCSIKKAEISLWRNLLFNKDVGLRSADLLKRVSDTGEVSKVFKYIFFDRTLPVTTSVN